MVRYKKEKRDQIKPVKLTKSEAAAFEEIAQKEDLSFSTVFRSYALMAIKAQKHLRNLARCRAAYKDVKDKGLLLENTMVEIQDLLYQFDIEYNEYDPDETLE